MRGRKIRTYDKEFKVNAVKLCLTSSRSYSEIAKDLGVPISKLATWVEGYQREGKEAFPGKVKPSDEEVAQ